MKGIDHDYAILNSKNFKKSIIFRASYNLYRLQYLQEKYSPH